MKLVGILLILTLVLAIVKAVLVALAITLGLALVFAFVSRPTDTLLFLGGLTLFGLAMAQPLACIIALGVLCTVAVITEARIRLRCHPRLNASRERH